MATAGGDTVGTTGAGKDLAEKIAKLVEEKGWNQEDFARISNLNRHTVRLILHGGPKRNLRNATISQCAEAFGLTVNELRTMTLERLLLRVRGKVPVDEEAQKLLMQEAALPELVVWLERNPRKAGELRADEVHELLAMQYPGGNLERLGVDHCVELLERRRNLICRVKIIAGTQYLDLLEQVVDLAYEKVAANGKAKTN